MTKVLPRGSVLALLTLVLTALFACGDDEPGSAESVTGSVAAELTSVTASGAELGKKGKVRVAFTGPVPADTEVTLTSSSAAVLTVPPRVLVPKGALTADVSFDALAIGQSPIFAVAGPITKQATASVVEKLKLGTSRGGNVLIEVGGTTATSFSLNAATPDSLELPLKIADGAVGSVPATLSIPAFSASGSFPIKALAVGTTAFSTTYGDQAAEGTLVVVDHARLNAFNATNVVEVGASVSLSMSVDAIVAKTTPIALTSSAPQIAAAPTNVVIPAGSTFASAFVPTLAPGQTDFTAKMADSTKMTRLVVVAEAQLQYVSTRSVIPTGTTTEITVSLNAAVAAPRRVALSSSDPSVVPVPAEVVVPTGHSSFSVVVPGVKDGAALITASLNGIARQVAMRVGPATPTLSISGTSQLAVGAAGVLNLFASSGVAGDVPTITLTSSDPAVVSVPAAMLVNGYDTLALTAKKTGAATVTASLGALKRSFAITVIEAAQIAYFGPATTVYLGQPTTTSLQLNAQPAPGTTVTFTSSAPAVLPAPPPMPLDSTSISVPLDGLSSGTAVLTATLGAATRSMPVYVTAPPAGYVYLSSASGSASTLQVGAATYGSAYFNTNATVDTPVTLSTTTPNVVTVPASVVLPVGSSYVYFPVQAVAPGTTDVTVSSLGTKRTFSVTVVATPTFTLNVPATIQVGTTATATLSSNALLPADVAFTVTSSNGAVATLGGVPVRLGAGSGNSAVFGVSGVSAGPAVIAASFGGTNLTANVTVAP